MPRNTARRVTIYQGPDDDLWRYRVQGGNWRTIESSSIGADRAKTIERMMRRKHPDAEFVIEPRR